MPTKEWLEKYESKKDTLRCKIALDDYFTEKKIGKASVDTLEIGTVHFPTGTILACDPLVELEAPFNQHLRTFLKILLAVGGASAPDDDVDKAGVLHLLSAAVHITATDGQADLADRLTARQRTQIRIPGQIPEQIHFIQRCHGSYLL